LGSGERPSRLADCRCPNVLKSKKIFLLNLMWFINLIVVYLRNFFDRFCKFLNQQLSLLTSQTNIKIQK
jgi:hypothetical protein